ncbi:hypothetical protein T484DRAFT_1905633, partial [Baffinella frigidus]
MIHLKRSSAACRPEAGRSGSGHDPLEALIRRVSVLEHMVDKAWEPRVRAAFTSPLAMAATAGMWYAMLCHQVAAICSFFAASLGPPQDLLFSPIAHLPLFRATVAKALGGLSRGMIQLAAWVLPVSQAGMALYGASVGMNGLKEAAELRERRDLILASKALDRFATAKLALIEQGNFLYSANFAAEVVAGPVLLLGQLLMALGGEAMLHSVLLLGQLLMALGGEAMFHSVAVLLTGAVLSVGSIAVKTVVELDTQKRFGYDDDSISVTDLLVHHVPSRVSKLKYSTGWVRSESGWEPPPGSATNKGWGIARFYRGDSSDVGGGLHTKNGG